MATPQFTLGTILIPISDKETVTIVLPPNWHDEVTENAKHYHSCLERLEAAKRLLTNPNHESGNTALIRHEMRESLIHLAYVVGSAATHLAEDEE